MSVYYMRTRAQGCGCDNDSYLDAGFYCDFDAGFRYYRHCPLDRFDESHSPQPSAHVDLRLRHAALPRVGATLALLSVLVDLQGRNAEHAAEGGQGGEVLDFVISPLTPTALPPPLRCFTPVLPWPLISCALYLHIRISSFVLPSFLPPSVVACPCSTLASLLLSIPRRHHASPLPSLCSLFSPFPPFFLHLHATHASSTLLSTSLLYPLHPPPFLPSPAAPFRAALPAAAVAAGIPPL
ncbi:hypothetical protein K438DRAFT_1959980 [Mycena galopus ATCC 62051]|nr:hypothetical protein K438DRAFT_1959980 [Mycena galopus ATCC 62051]